MNATDATDVAAAQPLWMGVLGVCLGITGSFFSTLSLLIIRVAGWVAGWIVGCEGVIFSYLFRKGFDDWMGGLLPFRKTTTLVGTGEWGLVSELLRFGTVRRGRPLLGTCQTYVVSY